MRGIFVADKKNDPGWWIKWCAFGGVLVVTAISFSWSFLQGKAGNNDDWLTASMYVGLELIKNAALAYSMFLLAQKRLLLGLFIFIPALVFIGTSMMASVMYQYQSQTDSLDKITQTGMAQTVVSVALLTNQTIAENVGNARKDFVSFKGEQADNMTKNLGTAATAFKSVHENKTEISGDVAMISSVFSDDKKYNISVEDAQLYKNVAIAGILEFAPPIGLLVLMMISGKSHIKQPKIAKIGGTKKRRFTLPDIRKLFKLKKKSAAAVASPSTAKEPENNTDKQDSVNGTGVTKSNNQHANVRELMQFDKAVNWLAKKKAEGVESIKKSELKKGAGIKTEATLEAIKNELLKEDLNILGRNSKNGLVIL